MRVERSLADLRQARPPQQSLRWVASVFGAGGRVTEVRYLPGGHALAVHRLDVVDGRGGEHTVVLRRWVRPDWDVTNPDFTVEREATALRHLEGSDVPAPPLVATDPTAAECDVPALVMGFLPGGPPEPGPKDLGRFAVALARAVRPLHSLRVPERIPPYRPYNDLRDPRPPQHSTRPKLWTRAFDVVGGTPPEETECLIHRDYHQGNTLWTGGELTGIVDWSYASRGSASVDLAHMRWNLVIRYGRETADRFLSAYLAAREDGFAHHPYWDLRTVVDLVPGPADLLAPDELTALEDYLDGRLAQV
ncbi:phosphotransferase family protein [Streptomyces sp. SS8]